MASDRAAKRRHLDEHFLDLEAGVEEDEHNDDPNEGEDVDEFLLQDDDEEEDNLPELYTHKKLQSEYDRVALNEEDWQGMINRARLRGLREAQASEEDDGDDDGDQVAPRPGDKLWEIGCQVGKEEATVFHLMQKVVSHNNSFCCLSAFARHTVPGRVFVEAGTSQQVTEAASGISELIPTKMRLVPQEKMTEVLSMTSSPRPKAQGWVRLLGNTTKLRPYKGDLALVVDVSKTSLLQLWLVPRIRYNDDENSSCSRPSPQLFNVQSARLYLGDQCIRKKGKGSNVIFQKNEFTSQGYLVLSRKELYICEEGSALPTPQELDGFLGCEALLPSTLVETRKRIESSKVEINDHVKILRGPFRGLLGKVMSLSSDEVDVHLPSQDLLACVSVWELAREFRVGDRVRARVGKDETIGWVTMVSDSHLSLFDAAKWSEITVSALQTEFYEDDKVIPLRSTPTLKMDWKAMKENPYQRLIGKEVKVVGQHHYKGNTGKIQDVTLAGEASVFLNIFNERSAHKIKIKNLCLMRENTLVVIQSGEALQPPRTTAPAIARTVPLVSTPIPMEEETSHNADAWDPCAPDPEINADELVWLLDPVFHGIRIQLRYRANPIALRLEFLGIDSGLVKVRHGIHIKSVPLSSLQAVPPTRKEDVVTSFSVGETYGKLYKIREFDNEVCVLRPYGQRAGRSEKHFHVITRELVQAFPI